METWHQKLYKMKQAEKNRHINRQKDPSVNPGIAS